MVLTNFECWAHDGGAAMGGASGMGLPFEAMATQRHVDPFNPRAVQQAMGMSAAAAAPQHVSSNCYYGFSYVNAAHELNNNNNNNTQSHNNNNNSMNGCMQNANGVNGMPTMMHIATEHNHDQSGNLAAGGGGDVGTPTVARCKKRYFVSDDDYANCEIGAGVGVGVGIGGLNVVAPKRCRYDDDGFAAAQYCNDFFSLPSTQIGTQSCLMDTEDCNQSAQPQPSAQQQQTHLPLQVDEAMCTLSSSLPATTTTTIPTAITSNIHFATSQQQITQQQQLHQQQQQQQAQTIEHSGTVEQHAQQLPTATVAYQQQHNYQAVDHNNRCVTSLYSCFDYPTDALKGYRSIEQPYYNTNSNNCNSTRYHCNLKAHDNNNKIANSNNMEDAAALYAATHGGSVYQFADNKTQIEDI